MEKIIQIGAEAEISLYKRKNWVFKDRNKKSYRIPELDEKIRKLRTRNEIKLLEKASKIIFVPKPIFTDSHDPFRIVLQFIDGKKLSENLEKFPLNKQKEICIEIGKNIAKLHNEEIIHGDLTTSNIICDSASLHTHRPRIFFIDFGLGFISQRLEDKAVDLHLLKEALEAKHFEHWEILFQEVLKGYKISKHFQKTIAQLDKVERRGRYKEKY